jgi:hypothetical protein
MGLKFLAIRQAVGNIINDSEQHHHIRFGIQPVGYVEISFETPSQPGREEYRLLPIGRPPIDELGTI